jgi:hypothetical protein
MLIKVVEKEKDLLLFILNHGMLIFSISYNWKKIMVKKKIEPEIFFMHFGFQISSWKELLKTVSGHSFVQIKLQDCMNAMEKNLKNCIKNTNKKEEEIKPSKLRKFGKP